MTIHGIAFRMSSRYHNNTHPDHAPYQVKLTLALSTAARKASAMSNYFGKNIGPDAVTVIQTKNIHFPGHAGQDFPNPFEYKLPFDPGKVFTLAAGKSLCWDLLVYDNDLYSRAKTSVYLDVGVLTGNCFNTNYGKPATVPGLNNPHANGVVTQLSSGGIFTVYGGCKNGPPSGWTLFLAGAGKWGGTALGPWARLWVDPLTRIIHQGPSRKPGEARQFGHPQGRGPEAC